MKWWLFDVQTALKYLISGKSKQTVMNDRYSSFRFLWAAQTMFLIQNLEAVDHEEYIRGKVVELSWVQLTIHAVVVGR